MTATRNRTRPAGCFSWLWLPCFSSSVVAPDGVDRVHPSAPPLDALSGSSTIRAPNSRESASRTTHPPPPVFQGGKDTENYDDQYIASYN